jgi:hypothetical protein
MFVYGIVCAPAHLTDLPADTVADYYTEHTLLVFPSYTRPAVLCSSGTQLSPYFLQNAKRLIENAHARCEMELEQPFITEEEDAAVRVIQGLIPGSLPTWYNIPRVVTPETSPQLMVTD